MAQAVDLIERGFSWHWRSRNYYTYSRDRWCSLAKPLPVPVPTVLSVGHAMTMPGWLECFNLVSHFRIVQLFL